MIKNSYIVVSAYYKEREIEMALNLNRQIFKFVLPFHEIWELIIKKRRRQKLVYLTFEIYVTSKYSANSFFLKKEIGTWA